jgi:AraC family transcriptional regulator, transcriptional activator FtrA
MSHVVAIPAYQGLSGYEYAMTLELFGLDRPTLPEVDYAVLTCRVEAGLLRTSHGLIVEPEGTIDDLVNADTIIVPGWRSVTEVPGDPFLDALRNAHEAGSRIAAICSGSFPLAHAGLLDDQTATTHWMYADAFRRQFPHIDLDPNPLYLFAENNVVTSAGSSAGLDLCLALVSADHGVATATEIANRMVVAHHRPGTQAQFTSARVTPFAEHTDLGPLIAWIENNLGDDLTIDRLARRAHLSRRTFIRRFQAATGVSPHAWITDKRLYRARQLLETTALTVSAIARRTGLGTSTNLRKHLTNTTGLTPTHYRAAHRAIAP